MLDVAGDIYFIFIFIFLFFLLCELWWMLDVAGDIRRAYKACI
jgi:hypothetical protein